MKITKNSIKLLIIAGVILVFGILFCCARTDIISVMMGIILIAAGGLIIIGSLVTKKRLLNSEGFIGGALTALGIFFLVYDFAGNLASIILGYTPYLMILIGSILIVDAVLTIIQDKKNIVAFVIELVIGIACLTLGICSLTVDSFKDNALLILGILMIVYAIYLAVAALLFPQILLDSNNEKKNVIDAE